MPQNSYAAPDWGNTKPVVGMIEKMNEVFGSENEVKFKSDPRFGLYVVELSPRRRSGRDFLASLMFLDYRVLVDADVDPLEIFFRGASPEASKEPVLSLADLSIRNSSGTEITENFLRDLDESSPCRLASTFPLCVVNGMLFELKDAPIGTCPVAYVTSTFGPPQLPEFIPFQSKGAYECPDIKCYVQVCRDLGLSIE